MRFVEQLQVLDRLDQLIRLKATGNHRELANRLETSPRNIYNLLDILKQLGAKIEYSKKRRTFYYSNKINFSFSFISTVPK